MPAPGSLIGPGLHKQIKDTIAKVDGLPIGGDVIRIPTELGGSDTYVPKTFRVATFTGTWSIGAAKSVKLTQNTSQTVSATNLFAPVGGASGDQKCAIAKDGTAWYLIAEPHGIVRGSFTAPWNKNTQKSVSAASAEGSFTATNYFANITGSGTKACAIAYCGGEWILIAAEC